MILNSLHRSRMWDDSIKHRRKAIRIVQKILAVDDEVENLAMVEYTLQNEFEVIAVKSAKMAFRYLEQNTPDLILMDIRMPEMDGCEAYLKMKQDERLAKIPVIFLTSANDVDTEDSCFEMGAVDFISKPFEPKIMLRRIKRTLELTGRVAEYTHNVTRLENGTTSTKEIAMITLQVDGVSIEIAVDDIYYVEVFGNTSIVRTVKKEYSVRETLEHMQDKLGDGFVRAGRSFLLQAKYVSEIVDDIVTMQSGKKVKLPRRNKKEIIQQIMSIRS